MARAAPTGPIRDQEVLDWLEASPVYHVVIPPFLDEELRCTAPKPSQCDVSRPLPPSRPAEHPGRCERL